MPVDISSRYANLPRLETTDQKGATHPTIGLRLAPPPGDTLFSHRMAPLETLESLAQQQFSNSRYWWRIADANVRVFPLDWQTGDVVRIPSVTNGTVSRTRNF